MFLWYGGVIVIFIVILIVIVIVIVIVFIISCGGGGGVFVVWGYLCGYIWVAYFFGWAIIRKIIIIIGLAFYNIKIIIYIILYIIFLYLI